MVHPEDDGRFLKSIFYDLPLSPLTRQEQTLRATTDILRTLQNRLPSQAHATYPAIAPRWETPPQDMHIDVPDPAQSLAPYFNDLSRGQYETAQGIQALASIGREDLGIQRIIAGQAGYQSDAAALGLRQRAKLVSQGRTQVMLLESLDEEARGASLQRQALIGGLFEIRGAIQHVGDGIDLVDSRLFGLEQGQAVSIDELQQHTRLLDEIARLEGRNADSLLNLQHGVHQLVDAAAYTNLELRGVNRRLDAVTAIGAKIADHLAHVEGSLDFFVLNMAAVRQPASHPMNSRADELWSRGEQSRRGGDLEAAANFSREGITQTHNDPRFYYSLAMLALETGTLESARKFFNTGFNYAQQNGNIAADFLWQMGKLAIILGHNEQAKALLERAHGMNRAKSDIWYDLALASIKLGDQNRAVYLLNNLLHIARRTSGMQGYVFKVMSEPFFAPILSHLTQ